MRELLIEKEIRFEEDKSMTSLTSWRIGGKASLVIYPQSVEELIVVFEQIKQKSYPYFIIGNGTNILVRDEGYSGIIVKLGKNFSDIKIDGNQVIAGASAPLAVVAKRAAENSLGDLSFLTAIPGSLGGAVIMNAGAFGMEMKDVVSHVDVFDVDSLKTYALSNQELIFSYRDSLLKNQKKLIVLHALLLLHPQEKEILGNKMLTIKDTRLNNQPYEFPNAGSVYKNPPGFSAGQLIEKAGLKGVSHGQAQISEKHANFIINKGNASADDVLSLMSLIEETIYREFNIKLEREVILL